MCPVLAHWPCMIEIAWVNLGRLYPGSYKQEILANRGQKRRPQSTQAIQSFMASLGNLRDLTGLATGFQRLISVDFQLLISKN